MSERPPIEFIDLKAQRQYIGKAMDEAILKVVHDGNYILGQQVQQFETELAAFCGAKHAIGVANGTDALILVLEALGIGPGDAVICPSFTFAATAEVVAWMGATPSSPRSTKRPTISTRRASAPRWRRRSSTSSPAAP